LLFLLYSRSRSCSPLIYFLTPGFKPDEPFYVGLYNNGPFFFFSQQPFCPRVLTSWMFSVICPTSVIGPPCAWRIREVSRHPLSLFEFPRRPFLHKISRFARCFSLKNTGIFSPLFLSIDCHDAFTFHPFFIFPTQIKVSVTKNIPRNLLFYD